MLSAKERTLPLFPSLEVDSSPVDIDNPTVGTALTVLVYGPRVASFYVDGCTCLNQLARIARFVGRDIQIVICYGHESWAWKGRGSRALV